MRWQVLIRAPYGRPFYAYVNAPDKAAAEREARAYTAQLTEVSAAAARPDLRRSATPGAPRRYVYPAQRS